MNAPLPTLYTEDEAAAFLRVKPCTVANERKRGWLGFIMVGRQVRHSEEHLLAYIRDRELTACAEKAANAIPLKEPRQDRSYARPKPDREIRDAVAALARRTFAPHSSQSTKNRKNAA
jgi:hypothetical protein